MRTFIQLLIIISFVNPSFSQITFNGCHDLFENQDYIFNLASTDATGRNVYTTSPIDGNQTCGGIGTCEFMIAWNNTESRWEFIADDGNGDFSAPYLIYTNTEASTPNPPSLNLGTWVENTVITEGGCGDDLSTSNSVLTGDVQDTVLSINDFDNALSIYPNPAKDVLNINTLSNITEIQIYDIEGRMVKLKTSGFSQVDVGSLSSGIYFLRIQDDSESILRKIVVE